MTLEDVIAVVGRQPDNDPIMSAAYGGYVHMYSWNCSQGTGDVGI
jgi:hypothetical protein